MNRIIEASVPIYDEHGIGKSFHRYMWKKKEEREIERRGSIYVPR